MFRCMSRPHRPVTSIDMYCDTEIVQVTIIVLGYVYVFTLLQLYRHLVQYA
jgi:hypothetical protein